MSKKSKRTKRLKNRALAPNPVLVAHLLGKARDQMLQGNFEEAIHLCQALLQHLPQQSSERVEALALMGMANGMLERYQEAYDIFNEALAIDPNNAELWYNHGLACHFTARFGQAVRDFERGLALLGTDKGELAQKFAKELASSREKAEENMSMLGDHFTLDQLIENEEYFQRGLRLVKAGKFQEGEQAFRHLVETTDTQPQYGGNLGVALILQNRYDEAEAALKQALEVDPDYQFAHDNLAKLPKIRRSDKPVELEIKKAFPENEVSQSITFYNKDDGGPPRSLGTVEKDGSLIKTTRARLGKQPPRYRFFLNPYRDVRFTTCPQCRSRTRQRKFPLFIHVSPFHPLTLNKTCRYCVNCDLLIVHQDQLEEQLAAFFTDLNPDIIGNDYLVVGTLDRADLTRAIQDHLPVHEIIEDLHDFKEAITFKPVF